MAYNKKTWLARLGQGLNKFIFNGGSKVTLDSAPDVVSQQGTPLSADNMNDLEQRIKSGFDDVDSAINAITPTLLWSNNAPTSAFEAQTVPLNLASYKFIVVGARFSAGYQGYQSYFVTPIGDSSMIFMLNIYEDNRAGRFFSSNSSGVTFGGGYRNTGGNDAWAVPYCIYGIK